MTRADIPSLGFGLGLRGKHHSHIIEHRPAIDWFEIISENYMFTDGAIKRRLAQIREHYPIVMHGVSLSIGTVDPLRSEYLQKLKELIDWLQPALVSDHLCWTGVAHQNTHDLLPVPYTEESLRHITQRLREVQDFLGRPILMENPSTYLEFKNSYMPEAEFIARMVEGSGCQLLLDVNNIYVSCYNHRMDVQQVIDSLPLESVAQIHLAGHSNKGTHIIDTHDDHVIPEVWDIYRYVIAKGGMINSMIEWDDHIPEFPMLAAELDKARAVAANATIGPLPKLAQDQPRLMSNVQIPLEEAQHHMQQAIVGSPDPHPEQWIHDKPGFPPHEQLQVYRNAYRWRLFDIVSEDFDALRYYLGDKTTNRLIEAYVEHTASHNADAGKYPASFPDFLHAELPEDRFAYELATLENALVQLSPLPETEALTPTHLSDMDALRFAQYQLYPRTALALYAFTYPVNRYYGAFRQDQSPITPDAEASWLAMYRHEDTMWRLDLEAQEYALLQKLFSGMNIGDALETLAQEDAGSDDATLAENLQAWFSRWIRNGLLANRRL